MPVSFIAAAIISGLTTAYLLWKFRTGGFADSILKDPKYQGEGALGGILLFIGYIGVSVAAIAVASIFQVGANIWLLWLAIHGPFFPVSAAAIAIVAVTRLSTWHAYRTGVFGKK